MPKIAYVQMKVTAGHPDLNTEKILYFIDEARAQGADIVIFPEFSTQGQMLSEGAWDQETFQNDCQHYIGTIIAASQDIFVICDDSDDIFEDYIIAKDGELVDTEDLPWKIEFAFDDWDFSGDADFCVRFHSAPFSLDKNFPAEEINCPMIRVGAVGVQNSGKNVYTFDGNSAVFNSRGKIVQAIKPFEEQMNIIDLDRIDKLPELDLPEESEVEKIYRALNFGVKNFLEQIGLNKVVIGASGGIDSAVAAALYVDVFGAENVVLVNMPSVFNSATTKNLSEQLARNLGCKYLVVPIQESVDWTVKQLEGVGISVSSFVRENIQARDRSSRILAAIAASIGGVFTCNANKAESTVGYATLYGDSAGFLSALADLWKFQVYALARHFNEKIFCREVIPQGIIDIVPSAELSNAQNVDEGKGDPLKYPYHDYLFRAFVEHDLTPEDILTLYDNGTLEDELGIEAGLVEKYFPSAYDFTSDLERWWKQFTGMGVAKRIQSPPILAVTDRPYGARHESQNGCYFTQGYFNLKAKLLGGTVHD